MAQSSEQQEAYKKLLKLMKGSLLVRNMSDADRQAIYDEYKDAPIQTIETAVKSIMASETEFRMQNLTLEQEANKAARELKSVAEKGEEYLRHSRKKEEANEKGQEARNVDSILKALN